MRMSHIHDRHAPRVCSRPAPRRTVDDVPALPARRRKPANRVAPTSLTTGPLTAPLVTVSSGETSEEIVGPDLVASTPKLSWRARAYRAVAAESAPTWSLDLRAIADGVEIKRSRAVIDLAMRVAEALLSTGASAADVTATVLRLTQAYGLRSVHVDVTFNSIAVSHHRGADDPVTIIRTVRVRAADYARLARLQELVGSLEADPVDIGEARARFDEIAARPHPYRRSVVTAATAVLGLAVCVLLDGSYTEILISLVNAIIVDRVQLLLARRRLPVFFSQMVGGAIPTIGAVLLIYARTNNVPGLANVSASAVVATGIVVLLAGLSVVGAAQDAIDGYYVTAGARSFEVFVLTFGIIVGVLTVLTISQAMGAPTYLAPYSRLTGDFGVQVLASALIAGAFAISSYAELRTTIVCVVTGSLGWIVYAFVAIAGFAAPAASGVAALVVGIASQVLARIWHVPALALSTAGIVPLLPGLAVYRGLYQLATMSGTQGYGPGFSALGGAIGVGLALAAGVSLGSYFARAFRRDPKSSAARAQARALRRAHEDPSE